jgi:lysophospholipase L1-like esterase
MEKKITLFFLLIVCLLWNPLSVYWLYKGTPMAGSKLFWLISGAAPLVIIWLRWRIAKDKMKLNKWTINLVFLFSFSIIVFFLALLGNRSLRVDNASNSQGSHNGIIFEPNSLAVYNTSEFNCNAKINSIGLRNDEIQVEGDPSIQRILCFGDSWTFGWGVEEQYSWPHQLQDFLNADTSSSKFEVINAGQGGQYTKTYKAYLKKAVPLLRPDIVLVGVLQIDDLAQIHEGNFKSKENGMKGDVQGGGWLDKIQGFFGNLLSSSFGNYILRAKENQNQSVDIKQGWRVSVERAITEFDDIQKMNFAMLSPETQQLFQSGDLNPGLLQYYVAYPHRYIVFNNPENPATKAALEEMTNDFVEMKKVCDEYGAKLIFISMPTNNFTGHHVIRTPMDELNPYLETNNRIDSMYGSVANSVNIPFFELTTSFKALEDKNNYFYTYDGHPNQSGYHEIAKNIAIQLKNMDLSR